MELNVYVKRLLEVKPSKQNVWVDRAKTRYNLKEEMMMSHIPVDYVQKVYAGLLGKTIGVRHGSNIEGWSYEKIKSVYGEVNDYLFDFKNFAADDDTNGPVFFIKALSDFACDEDISIDDLAHTVMNYVPYGHGFLWWGPYGVSSENTAITNLLSGAKAPLSGSAALNGDMVAEQIGGQIFIDTWGLVAPNDIGLAAKLAQKMASVTHDKNGVFGGMFVAACISSAFTKKPILSVIEDGLSVIPKDCTYTIMVNDMIDFHRNNPDNWLDCFWYIREHYWQDKYPGGCHIIPNSAIMALSMLYGNGDFSETINICNMCGWDTDCNVSNVGTILGVLNGLEGIDQKWRKPINDLLICSSVMGSMNIVNLANWAYEIAQLGYKLKKEPVPEHVSYMNDQDYLRFDFNLSGSTHAFRVATSKDGCCDTLVQHSTEYFHSGSGSLKVMAHALASAEELKAHYQTYYRPDDFNDSRYNPSFSPVVYPGQTIKARIMTPEADYQMLACAYYRDGNALREYEGEKVSLEPGQWVAVKVSIPHMRGALIDQVGVKFLPVNGYSQNTVLAYIDSLEVSGKPDYSIDFSKEKMEIWNGFHMEVSQFEYNQGIWMLNNNHLSGSGTMLAEAFTGDVRWKDYTFTASLLPVVGEYHNINFRVQGCMRSYAVGLAPENKLVLYKNSEGYQKLVELDFPWKHGAEYRFLVEVKGEVITIKRDGEILIVYEDKDNAYLNGAVGASTMACSRCEYKDFAIEGI